MANVKITALNSQSAALLADEDLFVVVDLSENETKRVNLRTIKEVATDPISSNVSNLQVGLAGTNAEMNARFIAAYAVIDTKDTIANVYQTYLTLTANDYSIYNYFQANVTQIANSIALKSNLTSNNYQLTIYPDGNVSFPTGNVIAGDGYISLSNFSGNNYARINSSNVELSADGNTWSFQSNGTLSLPFGGSIGDAYQENAPSLIGSANLYSEIVSFDKKAAVWVEDQSYEGQAGGGGVGIGINLDPTTGSIYGYDSHVWKFSKDGLFELPHGTKIDDTSNTFIIAPPGAANGQALVISAMSGDDNHVHITTEDSANTDLYIGYDSQFIKIEKSNGNVVIGTHAENNHWTFTTTGSLTLPGGTIFDDVNYTGAAVLLAPTNATIEISAVNTGFQATKTNAVIYTDSGNWVFDDNATLTLPGNGQVSQIIFSETEGAYINQGMGQLVAHTGNGSSFFIETGNANASWEFSSNGYLTLPNNSIIYETLSIADTITIIPGTGSNSSGNEGHGVDQSPAGQYDDNISYPPGTAVRLNLVGATEDWADHNNSILYVVNNNGTNINLAVDAELSITLNISTGTFVSGTLDLLKGADVNIETRSNVWSFTSTGRVNLPNGTYILPGYPVPGAEYIPNLVTIVGESVYLANTNGDSYVGAGGYGAEMGTSNSYVAATHTAVNIGVSPSFWSFNSDGTTIFPNLQVDLHNGGTQYGQVLKFGNSSSQAIITGPTPAEGASAQRIIIQGQRATGNGEGGDVYLWGGDSDVNGGDIKIYAGDADNVTTGYGGYINIDAGRGYNQGGIINLNAGSSTEQGGIVNISAGYASNGIHGTVNIYTNAGAWVFKADGNITLPHSGSIAPISGYMTLGQGLLVGADGSLFNANDNTWALYGSLSDPGSSIVLPSNADSANDIPLSITSASNVEITSNGTWTFGTNGAFNLPLGGSIIEGTNTIEIIPSGSSNVAQKLVIYPTAVEGNHIHITSGDQSVTDLYLGNDNQYFRVNANGNNAIGIGANTWTFDPYGTVHLPDHGTLITHVGDLNIESTTGFVNITSIGSTFTFDNHIGRFIMPAGGTITGENGSNVVIEGPGGNVTFTSEGVVSIPSVIEGAGGSNVVISSPGGNFTFTSGGALSIPSIITSVTNNVIIQSPGGNFTFGSSGGFSLPGANVSLGAISSGGEGISGSSNVSLTFLAMGTSGSSSIEWYKNTEDTANSTTSRVVANGYVAITTGNNAANTYSWVFDPVGRITFPNSDIQGNAFTQSYVTNVRVGLEGANTNISNITNEDVIFQKNVNIRGNLFLTGNSVLITSQTINFGDSLLSLGANNTINDYMDIGFYGHFYDTVANANSHTGLIRSAVNKDWMLFSNYTIDLEGNSFVDISNGNFALGNLRVAKVNATSVYSNGVELRSNDYATLLSARSNDYASYVILNSRISNLQVGLEGANTLISSASSDLTTNVTALQIGLAGSNTAISGLITGLTGSNTAITNLRAGLTGSNTAIENLQVGLSGSNGNISTNTTDILNLQSGLSGSNAIISNITVGISGSNTAISDLVSGLTGSNTIISSHTANITMLTGNIANLQAGLSGTNAILNSSNTANVVTGLVGANTNITNLQAGLTGANTSIANVRAGLLGANVAIAAITTNNIVFQRDVTVQGNLFLTGNSTALSTSTVVTGDTFLALANNNRSSDVVDVGLYSNFYDGSANNHTGLFRSAISKDWFLFRTYEGSITTNSTIDLSSTTFSLGNLRLATANVSSLIISGTNIITALTDNVNSLRSNDYATYQMVVGGMTAANTNISNIAFGLTGANTTIANLQVGLSGSNTLITNLIAGLTGANSTMASGASTANIVTGLNGANTKILNLQSGLSGSNTKVVNLQTGLTGSNTAITNLRTGLTGSNTAIFDLQAGLIQTNVLVNTSSTSITNLQTGLLGSNTNIVNLTSGLSGANTKILNLQVGLDGTNAAIAAITGSSVIFDHDVTVQGNLFLSGNSYVINANTISYGDNFLSIGANNTTADIVDMGIYGNFFDGSANSHTGLFRSAVSKDWFLFRSYTKDDPTTLLDIGHGSFSLANLRLDTANVSKLILNGTDIITTLTDNVTSLRSNDYSTYITLSSGLSGANTAILNLQGGIVGANNSITNLRVGLTGANTAITNLQAGLVGSNATISSLTTDITNLQTGLTEGANASISNLTVGLTGANTAISNLQGGLTGSNTTISSHTTSISNLVSGLTGSNSAITTNTSNITMLIGNVSNLQVGLAGANSLISSITVNYDNVVAGLNSANTNISNLQSNVASIRESIIGGLTGSNTNITILTGNIANLQVGLSGANTLINTVQNSLIAYANYANSTFGTASGNVNAVQSNLTAYALYANSTFTSGGGVNQGASYSWTNVHTFSNTIIINAVSANGSLGTAGQVLTSTGSDTYWANSTGTANITLTNATTQSFTANGTQNTFTLTTTIANQNNIIVTLNGLLQVPTTHYTISGTTLLFTDKPYANSLLEVRSLEGGIGLTGGPNNTGNVPQNAQSSSYTLANTDTGKHISITTGGVTVPNTTFATGDSVVIYNNSGSSQTITQGVNVTMRLVGTATTGNRTLAQYGLATILCVAANTFVSMGGGLT